MDATWIYMLVRTSKEGKKQEGISFLLADLSTPGITIRPIRNLAGHDEFAEVFFDGVRVPVANRVGPENQGWTIAKAQLGFERIFIGSPKLPTYLLGRLKTLARSLGQLDEPVFRERYTRLALDVADLTALYEGFVDLVRQGRDLGGGLHAEGAGDGDRPEGHRADAGDGSRARNRLGTPELRGRADRPRDPVPERPPDHDLWRFQRDPARNPGKARAGAVKAPAMNETFTVVANGARLAGESAGTGSPSSSCMPASPIAACGGPKWIA